jgi:uncharacterized protein
MSVEPGAAADFDADDFKAAKREAEKGEVAAAAALGLMYHLGQGTPQNYGEALKWYRRAAEKGNVTAQNGLGVMLFNGLGTPVNYVEAARWIQAAANQGHAKAQINLAKIRAQGKGLARNPNEASRWLHRAAEQGDAEAALELGREYQQGLLVRVDLITAYKWLLLAAAQGDPEAVKEREALAGKMAGWQVTRAQELAAAFVPRPDAAAEPRARSGGTGFFVTNDGYLLTAYHVVENASRIVVQTRKLRLAAKVVKADPTNDVALLKVTGAYSPASSANASTSARSTPPGLGAMAGNSGLFPVSSNFKPLPIADGNAIKLGSSVAALGFPNTKIQGRELKYTRGEINSLAGLKDNPRYYQVSTPVQPGNSGGPLLDDAGNVVGMILSRLNDVVVLQVTGSMPQNVNYALKSSGLLALLESMPAVRQNLIPAATPGAGEAADWLGTAGDSVVMIEGF